MCLCVRACERVCMCAWLRACTCVHIWIVGLEVICVDTGTLDCSRFSSVQATPPISLLCHEDKSLSLSCFFVMKFPTSSLYPALPLTIVGYSRDEHQSVWLQL